MVAQKINAKINKKMMDQIQKDIEEFNLSKGGFGNKIFAYYKNKDINYIKADEMNQTVFQFELNNINNKIANAVIHDFNKKGIESKSDILRAMLEDYFKKSSGEKEKILFHENCKVVNSAVAKKNKLWIRNRKDKEDRIVIPSGLMMSNDKTGCYLLAWCEKRNDVRNFKLQRFEALYEKEEEIDGRILEELEEYKKSWDPFLSINKEVKIKFDKRGLEEFEKATLGRPILKKEEKGIHIFQCAVFQGKNYFSRFLGKFDVIEPLELKEYFDKEIEYILKKHCK